MPSNCTDPLFCLPEPFYSLFDKSGKNSCKFAKKETKKQDRCDRPCLDAILIRYIF
ncbi:hypothetical protein AB434_1535 [Heyndrickxia coagulans]|uniref:Uncharacterized protein n=1 Tax=Heyndrickxia coagulans TaxID=1398 RepID=A0A133KV33_HEYCO|nr:hypothetical protein AB434_1535 [Heyndrickxia coagulans]KWZ83458.1 hypothetical protein HMPREF3213_01234 [Heyndrickxia coagulans]